MKRTYGKNLPFRQCGFEFTAEKKLGIKYKAMVSQYWWSESGEVLGKRRQMSDSVDLDVYAKYTIRKNKIRVPKWFLKNIEDDSCLECPTPIVKTRAEVSKYFREFKSVAEKLNLTLELNESEGGLGGCHIHIGMKGYPKVQHGTPVHPMTKLMFANLATFVTNYPELNWAFNDPNDVFGGNSMLSSYIEIEKPRHGIESANWATWENLSYRAPTARVARLFPTRYEASVQHPSYTNKECAINYNANYHTAEFRFFDMPVDLEQHLLHTEVAQKIFDHCHKMTQGGAQMLFYRKEFVMNKIPAKPNEARERSILKTSTAEQAIANFNNLMKLLKIDPKRCDKMRLNIQTRFEWAKEDPKEGYLA